MMATRRINAATTWLIRAFAPGCPTMLRSWSSKPSKYGGEALSIIFDLPTDEAMRLAHALGKGAPFLTNIRIGRDIVRQLTAEVSERHRTMVVDALLMKDDPLHD